MGSRHDQSVFNHQGVLTVEKRLLFVRNVDISLIISVTSMSLTSSLYIQIRLNCSLYKIKMLSLSGEICTSRNRAGKSSALVILQIFGEEKGRRAMDKRAVLQSAGSK